MIEQQVAGSSNKNLEAIAGLFAMFSGDILRFIAGKVGYLDAQDITSQTFEHLVRAGDRIDILGPMQGYAFVTANNLIIDTFRRRKNDPAYHSVALDSIEIHGLTNNSIYSNPAALAERKLLIDTLNEAISDLNPRIQQVLILRYRDGMPYDEIAEKLKTSVSAVKTLLYRGKEELRLLLNREEFDL